MLLSQHFLVLLFGAPALLSTAAPATTSLIDFSLSGVPGSIVPVHRLQPRGRSTARTVSQWRDEAKRLSEIDLPWLYGDGLGKEKQALTLLLYWIDTKVRHSGVDVDSPAELPNFAKGIISDAQNRLDVARQEAQNVIYRADFSPVVGEAARKKVADAASTLTGLKKAVDLVAAGPIPV